MFSGFVQDEIAVVPDRVYLSLGVKLEHNDYTGFGLQPSARISWTLSNRNMFWAAVSQAERTPARSDTNIRVNSAVLPGPDGLPLLISIFGNPGFKNEVVRTAEAGYRTQLTNRFSLDATVFFNNYRDLVSLEPGTPFLETSPPYHRLRCKKAARYGADSKQPAKPSDSPIMFAYQKSEPPKKAGKPPEFKRKTQANLRHRGKKATATEPDSVL